MNLILTRREQRAEGIFGELTDENGKALCDTLEHAFEARPGVFEPVIPVGTYRCYRGKHRLQSMTEDFSTFEVMGVPGHTRLLFHCGNLNRDSKGCILVGTREGVTVVNSHDAFGRFLWAQAGIDAFTLTVK